MRIGQGHLSYCTNIHSGESWRDHFKELQRYIPEVKRKVSPDKPFGIGLRLANLAATELHGENLAEFKAWLAENECYVFTINGFPYGGFHFTSVKDQVHSPDWTTKQRVDYTLRLADILGELLPDGVEGGISTSPLSYRHWHANEDRVQVITHATRNILIVVEKLADIESKKGKRIHLDLEPEPDGLLETGGEFIEWFQQQLLPMAETYFTFTEDRLDGERSAALVRRHVQLCYDICHFAVEYERHEVVLKQLHDLSISVGKIQISAAVKGKFSPATRSAVLGAFSEFDEPTYLHQVVAKAGQDYYRYRDLADALSAPPVEAVEEWRAHFHVPLFLNDYGALQSTQEDIQLVLSLYRSAPFSTNLEVETYTWEVLPTAMKAPLGDSIARELQWVKDFLS
jgi:hypothetical protein